jgi:hypothetical protein
MTPDRAKELMLHEPGSIGRMTREEGHYVKRVWDYLLGGASRTPAVSDIKTCTVQRCQWRHCRLRHRPQQRIVVRAAT